MRPVTCQLAYQSSYLFEEVLCRYAMLVVSWDLFLPFRLDPQAVRTRSRTPKRSKRHVTGRNAATYHCASRQERSQGPSSFVVEGAGLKYQTTTFGSGRRGQLFSCKIDRRSEGNGNTYLSLSSVSTSVAATNQATETPSDELRCYIPTLKDIFVGSAFV